MIIVCRKWQKDLYFYELLASVDAFTTISLALLGNEGGHSQFMFFKRFEYIICNKFCIVVTLNFNKITAYGFHC